MSKQKISVKQKSIFDRNTAAAGSYSHLAVTLKVVAGVGHTKMEIAGAIDRAAKEAKRQIGAE